MSHRRAQHLPTCAKAAASGNHILCTCGEHQRVVDEKRAARMGRIDSMPGPLRDLVHAYGLTVIDTLTNAGVTKPGQIRHVVETILNEFSPTRGSYSSQGVRTPVDETSPAQGAAQ